MSTLALLSRLKAAGVTVAVDGAQLKLKGPRSVIESVQAEVRAHKPALINLLTQHGPATARSLNLDAIAGRISAWLAAMNGVPKTCGIEAQTLKAITTDFALGPWAYEAVRLGWGDADLFAINGGLIPEMSRRALHFRSVGEDTIALINGSGAYEDWAKRDTAGAVPWWEDARCIAPLH